MNFSRVAKKISRATCRLHSASVERLVNVNYLSSNSIYLKYYNLGYGDMQITEQSFNRHVMNRVASGS